MAFRKKLSRGKSQRMFSKHAGALSTHPRNLRTPGPMDRGGIRL